MKRLMMVALVMTPAVSSAHGSSRTAIFESETLALGKNISAISMVTACGVRSLHWGEILLGGFIFRANDLAQNLWGQTPKAKSMETANRKFFFAAWKIGEYPTKSQCVYVLEHQGDMSNLDNLATENGWKGK